MQSEIRGVAFKDRTGIKINTNQGYLVEIIDYIDCNNCTVQFPEGNIVYNIPYASVHRCKNPYHKTVCNVGYIGNGYYNRTNTPHAYYIWKGIIRRCYSKEINKKNNSYKDCLVSIDWHNFQNFNYWFEENFNPDTMLGWHIDKDILSKGCKEYSAKTCCFVPQEININFSRLEKNSGISFRRGKYIANISVFNKNNYIGSYDSYESAFKAYKDVKEKHIKFLADKWKHKLNNSVYKAMYDYKVELK